MPRVVKSGKVWRMLEACLPGHRRELKTHHVWVTFQERRFNLPAGPHGKQRGGNRYDIELGHIRHLVRMFDIWDCARKHIPDL